MDGKEERVVLVTAIAKITAKNQVTIPSEIRKRIGSGTGDRLIFKAYEDGVVEMEVTKKRSAKDLYGALYRDDVPYFPMAEARSLLKDERAARRKG